MRKSISLAVAAAFSLTALLHARPSAALDVGISITVAPPALPVYEQPPIPDEGYIWTPGYWAWSDDGYYWVPGTWVEPPEPGLLWTPGYWGWENGLYLWHGGYWGPTIGFYGGVNYGFGYFGHGYEGGYWDHGAFRYNRAYNHFGHDVRINHVYNRTVVNNITVNRISYNGGHGGIQARADQRELTAEHQHHVEPIGAQTHQRDLAHDNPDLRASANHGRPGIAATSRPGDFQNHVIPARGAVRAPAGNQPQFNHAPGQPEQQHFQNNVQHQPEQQHFQPQPQVQHQPEQQHFQPQPQPQVQHQPEQQHFQPQPQVQHVPQQMHAPTPQPQAQVQHQPEQQHFQPQQQVQHAPQQMHAPTPQPQAQVQHVPQQQMRAPAPQPAFHAPQPPAQHPQGPPQQHGPDQHGDRDRR